MSTRAMLVAGLLITGAAAAMEWEVTAAGAAWSDPINNPTVKTTRVLHKKTTDNNGAGVARWDGKVIDADDEIRGLNDDAREAIETWRTFAIKRGYRVDLDETQRVLIVSDSDRFSHFSSSATVIERTLEALKPFSSPSDAPLVVLRASNPKDLKTALRASETLGFASFLTGYVEDGSRSDRRTVDARLSEAVVRQQLGLEAPFLSEWMADGLASYIADKTTGRAIVAGKARTLRSVQSDISRANGGNDAWRVSFYEVSGVQVKGPATPRESEAFAIVAHLGQHHAGSFARIVAELGRNAPTEGRAKYRAEERALERHVGKTALDHMSRALREGRSFRD